MTETTYSVLWNGIPQGERDTLDDADDLAIQIERQARAERPKRASLITIRTGDGVSATHHRVMSVEGNEE